MRIHGKVPLQLILHLGAKSKATIPRDAIADPSGLLQWLGPDRACIGFGKAGEVAARTRNLKAVLGQWVKFVPAA